MKVQVFSSKLTTKKNPSGSGVIDLDKPRGVTIFGEQAEADAYKQKRLIDEQVTKSTRKIAIEKLKIEGKLPSDFQEI